VKIVRLQLGAMGTNCYLLEDSGEVAIIDPGFEPERILKELARLTSNEPRHLHHQDTKTPRTKNEDAPGEGAATPRAKYIINTHGHIDHMGANDQVKQATGAKLLIGRNDAEQLTDTQKNLSMFLEGPVLSPEADQLLKEGDTVTVGKVILKVVETPGHTEGGICLIGEGFAFTGDTLFFDSIGRTDFPGGSERKIFASLRRLLELLPDDTMVYPGHNEPGRMGDAKRINPFLADIDRWA
jgi:glyoxylase-like metal-dependent hydrolase (beta-lactamase superfamily II)